MINKEIKNWNNFFLGLLVAVLPFLGLPLFVKNVIFIILGLLIAVFSLARLGRAPEKVLENQGAPTLFPPPPPSSFPTDPAQDA